MQAGNVPFSADEVYRNLIAELTAAKCWTLQPINRPPVFKSLCTSCWNKQAAQRGDVATYTLARAKTVREAIYLQTQRPDFTAGGIISKEAILSCAVHELMHYWSFEGSGLQDYNRRVNVGWDEVVADVLGFRVYRRTYQGQAGFSNYLTPYN